MAEKKHFRYDDKLKQKGIWINIDKYTVNSHYYLFGQDDEERKWEIDYKDRFYAGRHYFLFGILAGVRGGNDFMICDPKGFPFDASPEVKKEYDRWDGDSHTHSYLTLKELKEFDWNQLVDTEETFYIATKDPERDAKMQARLNQKRIEVVEENRFIKEEKDERGNITLHYKGTLAEMTPDFQETIKKLESYLDNNTTEEDIRLVFWFDN